MKLKTPKNNLKESSSGPFIDWETNKKARKEVLDWWADVEEWNAANGYPYNIENDTDDVSGMFTTIYDMANTLRKDAPELFKRGKAINNRYGLSQIKESVIKEGRKVYVVEPHKIDMDLYDIVFIDNGKRASSKWFESYEDAVKFIKKNARYNNWIAGDKADFQSKEDKLTDFGKSIKSSKINKSLKEDKTYNVGSIPYMGREFIQAVISTSSDSGVVRRGKRLLSNLEDDSYYKTYMNSKDEHSNVGTLDNQIANFVAEVLDDIQDRQLKKQGERIIDLYNKGSLTEDTIKQNKKWVNKGKEGTHGKFRTKKAADAQRKAMFANGYKEGLKEATTKQLTSQDKADIKNKLNTTNDSELITAYVASKGAKKKDTNQTSVTESADGKANDATDIVKLIDKEFPELEFVDERDLDDNQVGLIFNGASNVDSVDLGTYLDGLYVWYKIKGDKLLIKADEDANYLEEDVKGGWEDPEWRRYFGVDDDSFYDPYELEDNIDIEYDEEEDF